MPQPQLKALFYLGDDVCWLLYCEQGADRELVRPWANTTWGP